MTVENLMLRSPALYGASPAASEGARLYERAMIARRETPLDLSDVMFECGVQLLDAIRTGDEALIGRVVLAARNANLDRLADRAVGLDPDDDPEHRPTPDVAAVRVLLRASIGVTS